MVKLKCQADLDELKGLLEKSTREKVKELLKANVEKVEADLARLKRDEQIRLAKLNAAANGNTGAYTKKMLLYFSTLLSYSHSNYYIIVCFI